MATTTAPAKPGVQVRPRIIEQERARIIRTAYTYIAPAALVMALITFFPMIYQIWLSITNYNTRNLRLPEGATGLTGLLGQVVGSFNPALKAQFNAPDIVGAANYISILTNELGQVLSGYDFWRILTFNLAWTFINVFFHVTIGVAIAVLLNVNGLWFKRFYRAVYVIPWALPNLVATMVWRNMFDDQFGSINALLKVFGGTGLRWLQQIDPPLPWLPPFVRLPAGWNPWMGLFLWFVLLLSPFALKAFRQRWLLIFPWAIVLQILFVLPGALTSGPVETASLGELFPLSFYAVLIANIWLGWPFMMAIATGALQGIPSELYEAATVDGASKWQSFWAITVPLLRPAMVPAIIIGIMWTFNNFNVIYFITGGGPLHQTEILVTQAYRFVNETTINLGPEIGNVRPYGIAAAFAYIVFAILATITLITNRVSRATEAYYA